MLRFKLSIVMIIVVGVQPEILAMISKINGPKEHKNLNLKNKLDFKFILTH
jgi:hypothetical protein